MPSSTELEKALNPVTNGYAETILNLSWVIQNEDALKGIFPEDWTHVDCIDPIKLGFWIKVSGIDFRNEAQLQFALFLMQESRLLQRNGNYIRRNPDRVFTIQ